MALGGALGSGLGARWSRVTPRHCAWQAWHLVTSTFVSRGRRGTISHPQAFCVAGVAPTIVLCGRRGTHGTGWRAWVWFRRPGRAWRRGTVRGRRGTISHRPSDMFPACLSSGMCFLSVSFGMFDVLAPACFSFTVPPACFGFRHVCCMFIIRHVLFCRFFPHFGMFDVLAPACFSFTVPPACFGFRHVCCMFIIRHVLFGRFFPHFGMFDVFAPACFSFTVPPACFGFRHVCCMFIIRHVLFGRFFPHFGMFDVFAPACFSFTVPPACFGFRHVCCMFIIRHVFSFRFQRHVWCSRMFTHFLLSAWSPFHSHLRPGTCLRLCGRYGRQGHVTCLLTCGVATLYVPACLQRIVLPPRE